MMVYFSLDVVASNSITRYDLGEKDFIHVPQTGPDSTIDVEGLTFKYSSNYSNITLTSVKLTIVKGLSNDVTNYHFDCNGDLSGYFGYIPPNSLPVTNSFTIIKKTLTGDNNNTVNTNFRFSADL